mmetsp:Transcript_175/g.332  ORF Transcript_175/g.332 Transcript_175/m.332 type:complete len:228 (-) Transcript_175:449-1132(-)
MHLARHFREKALRTWKPARQTKTLRTCLQHSRRPKLLKMMKRKLKRNPPPLPSKMKTTRRKKKLEKKTLPRQSVICFKMKKQQRWMKLKLQKMLMKAATCRETQCLWTTVQRRSKWMPLRRGQRPRILGRTLLVRATLSWRAKRRRLPRKNCARRRRRTTFLMEHPLGTLRVFTSTMEQMMSCPRKSPQLPKSRESLTRRLLLKRRGQQRRLGRLRMSANDFPVACS